MKEKVKRELGQCVNYILVVIAIIINVQCHRTHGPVITVYSSSQDGDRLTNKENLEFIPGIESPIPVINVDEKTHFQIIDGFGASFNEAGKNAFSNN